MNEPGHMAVDNKAQNKTSGKRQQKGIGNGNWRKLWLRTEKYDKSKKPSCQIMQVFNPDQKGHCTHQHENRNVAPKLS